MEPYLVSFYKSRDYQLAWSRAGTTTPQAQALIDAIRQAAAKGLDPEDYDGARWAGRLALLRQPSASDAASFDVALTISGLRYVSALRIGRVDPRIFCFGFETDPTNCNPADILARLATSADVPALLDQLEPPFPGYRWSERALARYLQLARQDDGETLPALKKTVEPGDTYSGAPRLERLLRLLGDLPAGAVLGRPGVYEGPLVDAVKRFQARHGLDPDGRIGKSTLQQLNTPLSRRVRQLQLTLERWRWVPPAFSRPPIVVNIPEFRLRALNGRYETELEMKVVVGGAYRHQTPVFAGDMAHVIFRPYWNVPISIQRAELVPKLARQWSYLSENDYEIVDGQRRIFAGPATSDTFAQLRSGKLSIRQRPGPKNALGFVKFMFPNAYNVYLHGTPAKNLFSKSRRDFSHGCIRVEKPDELAAWVLRDLPEWTPERIHAAEAGEKTLQVNLPQRIPVLIVYGTAVVSETGKISFFADIYGHDASLDAVLSHGYPYSGWQPPEGACARPRKAGP